MPSHAVPGVSGGWALHRSVTLLHVFLLASAGILFIGATTLGWLLTTSLQRQALDDTSTSLTQYVDGVLRPWRSHRRVELGLHGWAQTGDEGVGPFREVLRP